LPAFIFPVFILFFKQYTRAQRVQKLLFCPSICPSISKKNEMYTFKSLFILLNNCREVGTSGRSARTAESYILSRFAAFRGNTSSNLYKRFKMPQNIQAKFN